MANSLSPIRKRPEGVCQVEYAGGKCFYCGQALNGNESPDHFIPRSRGGVTAWTNIVLTHPKCNFEKRGRMPTVDEHDRFLAVTGHRPPLTQTAVRALGLEARHVGF